MHDFVCRQLEVQLQPIGVNLVLASAEGYPGRAYGLNALVVWPRLFVLLPEEEVSAASAARDSMHFLLLLSFFSWTLALLARVAHERGLSPTVLSEETIRRALLRLAVGWKRAKRWLTSPDPAYAHKKAAAIA